VLHLRGEEEVIDGLTGGEVDTDCRGEKNGVFRGKAEKLHWKKTIKKNHILVKDPILGAPDAREDTDIWSKKKCNGGMASVKNL